MAQSWTNPEKSSPDKKVIAAGTLLVLLVLLVAVASGIGSALALLGLVVLLVGGYAVVRGRADWARIVSRRMGVAVLGAGLVVLTAGAAMSPSTQEVASATPAPVVSAPTSATPAPASAAPASTSAAPQAVVAAPITTTSQAPVLPPAPVLSVTCPAGGTVASPVFGQQISAAAPYTVAIDYGDGEQYSHDDQHLAAIFTHTYAAAGSFVVKAVLTDAAGQTATGSCTYTWNQPAPVARSTASSGGSSSDTSSGSGSTGDGSVSGGSSSGSSRGSASPVYANCDDVRAAGAAPIHPGDPGFQPKFDRDDDGVGCE